MSMHWKQIGAITIRILSLIVLAIFAGNGRAMTINPSPSYTGTYTVSFYWTGCYEDWSYYPYWVGWVCYYLEEQSGGGEPTIVPTDYGSTSWSATDRAPGTYTYQVYLTYGYGDKQIVDGPVSVTVGTPAPRDPLLTQLGYEFRARQGDIDADGRTDIFVERVSGGVANNGVLDTAILRQDASSGAFSVATPTAYESSLASSWPLSSASVVVNDFNVDGSVDVEVKGVAQATGVAAASDQIIFSSGASLQAQPLGVRAVDASLKKFVGNMLDYIVNPNYFWEYADYELVYGSYSQYYCGFSWGTYSGILEEYGSGLSCSVYFVYVSGYFWDNSGFSSAAVAIWTDEQSVAGGTLSGTQSTERAQQAAEGELGVPIGGWPMEEVLGETGEHTDADVRRGLETFWAILGIGRANAAEVDTDEAPAQLPPAPDRIHIMTREIVGWWPGADHSAIYHSEGGTNIGDWCSASDTDDRPLVNGRLRARSRWIADAPAFTMVAGEVTAPYFLSPGTFWETVIKPAHWNYWGYAENDLLPYNFRPSGTIEEDYNSNGYIHGLVDYSEGITAYDFTRLVGGETPVPRRIFSQ